MLTIWAPDMNYSNVNLHIGSGVTKNNGSQVFDQNHVELAVQADGDELEKIRHQFQNIPMTNNRVVRWYGETARFIYENLEL